MGIVNPGGTNAITQRFRLNFALQTEKILCYDRFPKRATEGRPSASTVPRLHEDSGIMDIRVFCVYNLAQGVFLSSKVTAVDGVNEPLRILKVLVNGLGLDKESGLWICPLSAIPAVPRLFPFDLLYLDRDQRVIESVEIVPGAEFPPYRGEVAGALVLARRTLESTQTRHGDRLIIAVEAEIDHQIAAARESDAQPIGAKARSSKGRFPGRFDKNGKPEGTAVSAVLTEPFSPVVARSAEGGAFGQAVAAIEPESGIKNSSAPETKEVKKPVQVTASNVTGQASSEQAKAAIAEQRPDISTSEPIVERRRSGDHPVINGQKGGVEDLFSNWVDAPTSSSAWIARNPRPEGAPTVSSAPGVVASSLPDKNPPGPEPAPKGSDAVQPQAVLPGNATPKIISAGPEPNQVNQPQKGGAPAQAAPAPTRTAVPQSPTTTTFTVGNLGEWRVSMPTSVGPVATGRSPGQTRPGAPAADKESTGVKETNTEEKAAPEATAKIPDSPAVPLATSSMSRVAAPPLESMRSGSATKVREAVEAAPSKLGKDKTVTPAAISRQGIVEGTAASAHSQSAAPDLPENSKLAASSVAANLEKKPVIDVSSDARARLLVNLAEKVKSPLIAAAVSAVREKVQTQQPVAPTAKVGVWEQSTAAASKPGKVESKAVVPAKNGTQKAPPQASIGRPEANGKSQTGPLSLGTRFKRWLNPAPPVASDRRRAHRRYVPGMVAHYYTGGAPKPHDVADISMTGFYLLTEDRWMPETMIQMILQKPCAKGERKQSITVLSRIVRRGSDGVAVEFVMPEGLNPMSHDIQPSQATDKFTLARFL